MADTKKNLINEDTKEEPLKIYKGFEEMNEVSSSEGFIREFFLLLMHNKKWWITPIIICLLIFGLLIILSGSSAAPFIYTLF